MEIEGVVNDNPVPKSVPPVDAEYQFTVVDEVAVRVTVLVPHRLIFEATGEDGIEFTIACTASRLD